MFCSTYSLSRSNLSTLQTVSLLVRLCYRCEYIVHRCAKKSAFELNNNCTLLTFNANHLQCIDKLLIVE